MKHAFGWMRLHVLSAVVVATALTIGCTEDGSPSARLSGLSSDPGLVETGGATAGAVGEFGGDVGSMPQGAQGADAGMPLFESAEAGIFGAELEPEEHVDRGVGDGSDVVTIGDSWMSLGFGSGIQESLLATSGQPYRVYGVPATRLLDDVIPNQYRQALAENPDIKTLLMTGGGNDILQNPLALFDCPLLGDICKGVVDDIVQRYLELADEAASDGVEDVVIVVYSRGTAMGPEVINYVHESIEMTVRPKCEATGLRCYIVDADEVSGETMQLRDGIHPTDANYDLIGEYVHDLMVAEGMRR